MNSIREDSSGGLPPPKSHYYRILLDIGDALATAFNGAITEVPPEEAAGVPPPHQQFLHTLYRIKQAIETAQAGGGGGNGVDITARQMAQTAQQTANAAATPEDLQAVMETLIKIELATVPDLTLENLRAVWTDKGLVRGDFVAVRAGESIYLCYAYSSVNDIITVFIGYGVDLSFDGAPVINAKIITAAGAQDFKTAKSTDVAAKQDKITATGATNLLTAPVSAGGQPGTKAIADFADATHTHDVDNIHQFSPGQYATDLPDPTATKTVKNWIRDIVNALNRLLSKTIVFTPMSYPCWVQLSGSFSYAQEIEFLSVSDFDSSSPWNCYARFKYNGNGVVRDMVPGGSTWYGTLQWFKTSLWIPVPSGGCALHIQCGRGIDLSLVTTDPARTPVTIVTM